MGPTHISTKACRQCPRTFTRPGVTCGKSECQQAEYHDNAMRAKARGKRVR